jgi:hypothetical protein
VDTRLPQIEQTLDEHEITFRGVRKASPRMEEAFISMINQLED